MAIENRLIIEAAINGATRKTTNPNVPRTADEIVTDAIACIEAGAAIIHCHIENERLGVTETVEQYADIFSRVLAAHPDALIYPTWRAFDSSEERHAHMPPLAERGLVRLSYIDPGSTNAGAGLDEEGLPKGSFVYRNTYDDCRHVFDLSARHGLGPMIAVFEPGFLRVVKAYERVGRLPRGAFVRFYFGGDYDPLSGKPTSITFGMPPDLPCLEAYLHMFRESKTPWAVAVLGGDAANSEAGRTAIARGGHLRLGLEDFGGSRQPSNVDLIREAVALAAQAGRRAATPREAAVLLGL